MKSVMLTEGVDLLLIPRSSVNIVSLKAEVTVISVTGEKGTDVEVP